MNIALRETLETLDLEDTGNDTFGANNVNMPGGRVYGGQVLAQSLIAAGRTVAPERVAHSIHGYFLRRGDVTEPLTFAVDRLNDGKSFSTRRVQVLQKGLPILSGIASFQEVQSGIEHQDPMPQFSGPDGLRSAQDELGDIPDQRAQFFSSDSPFDIRHVDSSLYLEPGSDAVNHQAVWMRTRGSVPENRLLNSALLAFACDQTILEPVLRRHRVSWMSPGLSVASLDHAMWWHRPVEMSEWFLFVQSSPSAQGGRGLGTARVYQQDGRLVATIAQEGMVRLPHV